MGEKERRRKSKAKKQAVAPRPQATEGSLAGGSLTAQDLKPLAKRRESPRRGSLPLSSAPEAHSYTVKKKGVINDR